jgi:EF-P beta-lysylation protein EpmB
MNPSWQSELADSFTDPVALLTFLGLATDNLDTFARTSHFPFRVTQAYADRIRKGDPQDPLLRQVLPDIAEKQEVPGFNSDPVGDLSSVSHPGVLHKYQGRALLITTGACAIHCRYCFRREFPYDGQQLVKSREHAALESIGEDRSIQEVILSGGDPLVLSNQRLAGLVKSITRIPHVRRLRIHSRLPVVLPNRVDQELLEIFDTARLPTVMVIHANHPQELDESVRHVINAMTRKGTPVLNQAVLLRGINDNADCLVELSEKLFEFGALPYYLHLLDRVSGTAHFEVPEGQGRQLMEELRKRLPGYLVPRLVREIGGAPYKQPV